MSFKADIYSLLAAGSGNWTFIFIELAENTWEMSVYLSNQGRCVDSFFALFAPFVAKRRWFGFPLR
jgi:hypothetical protein